MSLDAVYQCRVLGGKFVMRAEHCRFAGQFSYAETAAQKPAGFFVDAAEHGRQTVKQVKLGDLAHVGRNISYSNSPDEVADIIGNRFTGLAARIHERSSVRKTAVGSLLKFAA
jgi:hypothetical protein